MLLVLLVLACGRDRDEVRLDVGADTLPAETAATGEPAGATAAAELADSAGRSFGVVNLREGAGGVTLTGTLQGLPPGEHGFHIHAVGRCDPPSFETAGGHFNPDERQHGFDDPGGPHPGDLRNITVAADGSVAIDETNPRVTLTGGASALLDADGSALVIHAGPDDYRSQPSGDSGGRIACGVIHGG